MLLNCHSLAALLLLALSCMTTRGGDAEGRPQVDAVDAHLPLAPQEESPIRFEVKFQHTHILAGEEVRMELTLQNTGTEPFRVPTVVPHLYLSRVHLYLDHPRFGPRHPKTNVFSSTFGLEPWMIENIWKQFHDAQLVAVMPGEVHTIRSGDVFAEAGIGASEEARDAVSVINALESARIRTVIRLDDGSFVPSDWVAFTIEQPETREEDWRDDIVMPRAGGVERRYGLLRQRVGSDEFWFIASVHDKRITRLQRLPFVDIVQVIPPERIDERLRNIAVLGTDSEGAWHYYGPLPREEIMQRGETVGALELGHGKTWELRLTDDNKVEILEVQ